MDTWFLIKKTQLLESLRMLALKHNRDYYVSLLPIVEQLSEDQTDILDMYVSALSADGASLIQSRRALVTVWRCNSLLS